MRFLPCLAEECRTDNGSPFQGKEFATYAKTHGFRHRKITPLQLEANGELERFVRTLQKFIVTATAEGRVCRTVLPSLMRVYRSTPHTVTGKSPYFLLFGSREMRVKIPQSSYNVEEDSDVRQKLHLTLLRNSLKSDVTRFTSQTQLVSQQKKCVASCCSVLQKVEVRSTFCNTLQQLATHFFCCETSCVWDVKRATSLFN